MQRIAVRFLLINRRRMFPPLNEGGGVVSEQKSGRI